MKILHVGDIHLGCRLDNNSRNEEIQKVFEFILKTVAELKIGATLLTGDIFDNGHPSTESQDIYYNFLLNLQEKGCKQIIVIAGNHDSAAFLEAPKGLLKRMDIHVVGNIDAENLEQEVIALGDEMSPSAYVCAVPYLEFGDVCGLQVGESSENRAKRLAQGIADHYNAVWQLADKKRQGRQIPIIGMGHLYAKGSSFRSNDNDNADDNVVGTLEGVDLQDIAASYDYMALGHIHKPQKIAGHANWRYAGAILPMKIQESQHAPQLIVLDSENMAEISKIIEIPFDCYHKLVYIEGDMETLRRKLKQLRDDNEPVWVKTVYTGAEALPNWAIDLRLELRETNVQIVEIDVKRKTAQEPGSAPAVTEAEGEFPASLAQMTPEEVFTRHLDKLKNDHTEEQRKKYLELYREAQGKVYNPAEHREATVQTARGVMHFKRLFIKNVNSLYGEHLIDFDSPEFSKGIFLISGPTGAGKSSILDAICLALYDETPRVDGISTTHDPVISAGQKEMEASLTFMLGDDEYCASFSHSRTREGSQDPFGTTKHLLSKNGKEVASKKGQKEKAIESLIGLTREQFTQCVLLAQGSFNEFLKQKIDDRYKILEQVTDTKIYSQIGMAISEKYRDAANNKKTQEEILKNFTLKSEDEVEALRERETSLREKQTTIEAKINEGNALEIIFANVEKGEADVQAGKDALQAAQDANDGAGDKRTALDAAKRAQLCQDAYTAWQNKDESLHKIEQQMQRLQDDAPKLETMASQKDEAHSIASQNLETLTKTQADEQKLFIEVRALDASILEKEKEKQKLAANCTTAKTAKANAEKAFKAAEALWERKQKAGATSSQYLADHPNDGELVAKGERWAPLRTALVERETANAKEADAIDKARVQLSGQKAENDAKRLANTKAAKVLEAKKKSLDALKAEKEQLLGGKTLGELRDLWAAAGKLQDFFKDNDSRQNFLAPSQPCPLCGSTVHPYCDGTAVPECHDYSHDVNELKNRIQAIEKHEQDIQKAEKAMADASATLKLSEQACETQANNLKASEEDLAKRASELASNQDKASASAQALAEELRQALQVEWTDHGTLPPELATRIKGYNGAKAVVDGINSAQQEFGRAEAAYNAVKDANAKALADCEAALAECTQNLAENTAKRRELFGDDSVDQREKSINKKVKDAQAKLNTAMTELATAKNNLEHNKQELAAQETQRQAIAPELSSCSKELDEALAQQAFKDKQAFLDARLTPEQLQKLDAEIAALKEKVNTAKTTLDERLKSLEAEKAKVPENMTRQANQMALEELKTEKQGIQEDYTKVVAELQIDEKNRQEKEESLKKLAEMEELNNCWKHLDDVFGKQDGSRFAIIAQSYTFKNLLHCANKNRLAALRDHFTLVSGEDDPLELEVIDHYRCNQIRSSRNLSGGEQFEVSLALALGLADMSSVSQKASLGNVLLDEGFGTLDDDSLDSALELLTQLNTSSSKLVGIISHVAKLKERIPTQICVYSSAGMGRLEGAGVKSLQKAQEEWAEMHNKKPKENTKKGAKKNKAD